MRDASEESPCVPNGMSEESGNERNADIRFVVGITAGDFPDNNPLVGIEFQRELESKAVVLGGSTYDAPAQLVGDFLKAQPSTELGSVQPSYTPGVNLTDLSDSLPAYAIEAIRKALPAVERKIKGCAMNDAVLPSVEKLHSSLVGL